MGHVNPHMIFSNYREIVTPEEAERYWQIFPRAQAENLVPIASTSAYKSNSRPGLSMRILLIRSDG
jgi:hypothetical protein